MRPEDRAPMRRPTRDAFVRDGEHRPHDVRDRLLGADASDEVGISCSRSSRGYDEQRRTGASAAAAAADAAAVILSTSRRPRGRRGPRGSARRRARARGRRSCDRRSSTTGRDPHRHRRCSGRDRAGPSRHMRRTRQSATTTGSCDRRPISRADHRRPHGQATATTSATSAAAAAASRATRAAAFGNARDLRTR